ncbi:sterol carrier protein 2-like isoform X2 [Watersipora subatra]
MAYVIGVGMTKFEKPQSRAWDYPDMGREAGSQALLDAALDYHQVQAVVASYCYGEPTCGQRAAYELGLTGVPIFNTNNNCSSGSSALMLARHLVLSGSYNCVMALGFEKMERGLSEKYDDKVSPVGRHMDHMVDIGAKPGLIQPHFNAMTSDVIKLFAYAAQEYMGKNSKCTMADFTNISYKNRKHGEQNPRACLQKAPSKKKIEERELCHPIYSGMAAPTADGGGAAIVCNQKFLENNASMQARAVEIIAQHMVTDMQSSFRKSFMDLSGFSMAKKAAEQCYQDSGLTAQDVDVLEVHDCFSCNELMMYEALGLTDDAVRAFNSGLWRRNKNGGDLYLVADKWVVNPSGGLESKGHPIGATGLGQCNELVTQLRGEAGKRQVDDARIALQHNFGIGGAAVVTMYKRYQPKSRM